jgi:peroxin-5
MMVTFFSSVEPSGRALFAVTAIVTVVCAGILFHVESFWHDEVALFSTCVEMAPRSSLCHDRLGMALKQRGEVKDAELEFQAAQEIAPDDGANLYNLGLVHVQMGRMQEALGELKRALAMLPDVPAGAYVEYAKFADGAGQPDERDDALHHAEQLPGGVAAADFGRAQLKYLHKDFTGAEALLRSAIALEPRDADQWTMLGMSLAQQHRSEEALEAYQHSLRLRPDSGVARIVTRMRGRGVDRSDQR